MHRLRLIASDFRTHLLKLKEAFMARSPRRPRAVIDASLVTRFDSLADAAHARFPEVAVPLIDKLAKARLAPPGRLPAGAITIGSKVSYRDELSGSVQHVTLVWPEHADISRGDVSVLTPVGVALLGLAMGDQYRWTTRTGAERALTVLDVAGKHEPLAQR